VRRYSTLKKYIENGKVLEYEEIEHSRKFFKENLSALPDYLKTISKSEIDYPIEVRINFP